MKRSIEWAAGLFEGEGHISNRISEGRKRYTLDINMTDRDVMEDFAEFFGLKCNGPYHPASAKPHHLPFWRVSAGSKDKVREMLDAMLPHLGNRKAYSALNILDDLELN